MSFKLRLFNSLACVFSLSFSFENYAFSKAFYSSKTDEDYALFPPPKNAKKKGISILVLEYVSSLTQS